MYEKEEEKLGNYKKMLDHLPVPEKSLDDAILAGFQQAKSEEKRKPRKKKWMFQAALVAVILIAFVTSIRVSPVFAEYISAIPGMEKIVELIRHDKGMVSAVNNDYYQELGISAEKNGLEIIIDGAIADENGIVLFYTLNTDKKQNEITMNEATLTSADDEELDFASMSYGFPHTSEKGEKSYSGTIEYFFHSPFESRDFELDLKIVGDTVDEEFVIPFSLKEDFKDKKTYELNKTVTMDGQNFTFIKAVVYPLRVAVHVKRDPDNTKKLLHFEDLRLVDEHGETWGKITDGLTVSHTSEEEEIIYLQSNYFKDPKELYLVLNRIQAIDKEKSSVVVDTEKGEILQQPEGNKLRDVKVTNNGIDFTFHTKQEFPFGLFGQVKDNTGKEIELDSSSYSPCDNGVSFHGIRAMNLKQYQSPISIEISFFPEWISGNEKIRIK